MGTKNASCCGLYSFDRLTCQVEVGVVILMPEVCPPGRCICSYFLPDPVSQHHFLWRQANNKCSWQNGLFSYMYQGFRPGQHSTFLFAFNLCIDLSQLAAHFEAVAMLLEHVIPSRAAPGIYVSVNEFKRVILIGIGTFGLTHIAKLWELGHVGCDNVLECLQAVLVQHHSKVERIINSVWFRFWSWDWTKRWVIVISGSKTEKQLQLQTIIKQKSISLRGHKVIHIRSSFPCRVINEDVGKKSKAEIAPTIAFEEELLSKHLQLIAIPYSQESPIATLLTVISCFNDISERNRSKCSCKECIGGSVTDITLHQRWMDQVERLWRTTGDSCTRCIPVDICRCKCKATVLEIQLPSTRRKLESSAPILQLRFQMLDSRIPTWKMHRKTGSKPANSRIHRGTKFPRSRLRQVRQSTCISASSCQPLLPIRRQSPGWECMPDQILRRGISPWPPWNSWRRWISWCTMFHKSETKSMNVLEKTVTVFIYRIVMIRAVSLRLVSFIAVTISVSQSNVALPFISIILQELLRWTPIGMMSVAQSCDFPGALLVIFFVHKKRQCAFVSLRSAIQSDDLLIKAEAPSSIHHCHFWFLHHCWTPRFTASSFINRLVVSLNSNWMREKITHRLDGHCQWYNWNESFR